MCAKPPAYRVFLVSLSLITLPSDMVPRAPFTMVRHGTTPERWFRHARDTQHESSSHLFAMDNAIRKRVPLHVLGCSGKQFITPGRAKTLDAESGFEEIAGLVLGPPPSHIVMRAFAVNKWCILNKFWVIGGIFPRTVDGSTEYGRC